MTTFLNDDLAPADSDEQAEAMAHDALVFDLSVALARLDGCDDPHHLIWEGGPIPEPWGEVWQRYEPQAKEVLSAIGDGLAQAMVEALRPTAGVMASGEAQQADYERVHSLAHAWAQECYFKGLGRPARVDETRGAFQKALRALIAHGVRARRMAELTKADTVALWHAVEALAWQCRAMKGIEPPLSMDSQKAKWERLRAARAALRKVNAIRNAGEPEPRMAFCPACFVEVTQEQADAQTNAARVLAEFARTAPGRLPSRVQEALAVVEGASGVPGMEKSRADMIALLRDPRFTMSGGSEFALQILAALGAPKVQPLPFDREYVWGYLSEVLAAKVGDTKDPHICALMAWLLPEESHGVKACDGGQQK